MFQTQNKKVHGQANLKSRDTLFLMICIVFTGIAVHFKWYGVAASIALLTLTISLVMICLSILAAFSYYMQHSR